MNIKILNDSDNKIVSFWGLIGVCYIVLMVLMQFVWLSWSWYIAFDVVGTEDCQLMIKVYNK